ncbi:helix-turn-helix domain-containing protein [Peribacillus sp. JNUCC 23]
MIGKNIYEIRKKRGLSLTELSERSKISKSYLSNIERNINTNPSIDVLTKLANVLGVDLKILLVKESKTEAPQQSDNDWIDFINDLKRSDIGKDQIQEFKTLIEFIKWKSQNSENN